MTSITNTVASKLVVAFVAVAMAFSMVAPAQAQTVEELQTQIAELMTLINSLQAQTGQGGQSVASGVCPYVWTRNLSQGSTGDDVMKLQQFLNADAETRVAAEGAGSVGAETMYYGPATAAAVSKMQVKYRAEVLTPSGLVNPTGFFGPASRAKANAACATPSTPTDPTDPVDEDEDTDGPVTLSGEADLVSVEMKDADDTTIEEGDTDVVIGVLEVEFENGDAEITRIDVRLDGGTPWQAFDSLSLWVDGDMVAEVDAGSRSDYLSSTNGSLRFTGLDIVAMEDEVLEIAIGASIKSTVRNLSTENDEWDLAVDAIRYVDADGVTTTETSGGSVIDTRFTSDNLAEFTIEAEGTNDDAEIKRNSSDPEATTLKVESNSSRSDEFTMFVFNIDVDEDSADTELDMAYATVTLSSITSGKSFGQIVDTVKLTVDGQTVTGKVKTGDTSTTTVSSVSVVYEFDFKGLELDADDVYEASVALTFKGQNNGANYADGVQVAASVVGSDWELTSVKTGDKVLSGQRSSRTHTLSAADADISAYAWAAPAAGNFLDFTFTVEANDEDFDVLLSSFTYATTGTATTAGPEISKTSGEAEAISGGFTVEAGERATFRIRFVLSGANGAIFDATATAVAGQPIPNDKQVSPTVTRNVTS
jgi:hypothetical protein